jgi:hypothetical protein
MPILTWLAWGVLALPLLWLLVAVIQAWGEERKWRRVKGKVRHP